MRATHNALRHGDARAGAVTRLHCIWRGILKRCNPNLATPNPKYAGRGIAVCEEWKRYEIFKAWALSNGYRDDLTIERRDNDGDYEPGNCTWIPSGSQALNRRTSRRITINGETKNLVVWARENGLDPALIRYRIAKGWPESTILRQVSRP